MSMFVLFPRLFWRFCKFGLFGDKPYTKAVKQDVLVNFSRVQKLSNNFSKRVAIIKKVRTNLTAGTYQNFSNKKLYFGEKVVAFWIVLWDVWMIKITIKTNQIEMDFCFFQK